MFVSEAYLSRELGTSLRRILEISFDGVRPPSLPPSSPLPFPSPLIRLPFLSVLRFQLDFRHETIMPTCIMRSTCVKEAPDIRAGCLETRRTFRSHHTNESAFVYPRRARARARDHFLDGEMFDPSGGKSRIYRQFSFASSMHNSRSSRGVLLETPLDGECRIYASPPSLVPARRNGHRRV